MFTPVTDNFLEMTPVDFEKFCLYILENKTKGLNNVKIYHNKIMEVYDGKYQLDGYIEFDAMGVTYKTIVECKHYKAPISREIVQKVYDNLRAVGAQKGIVISTSNFQSGAIAYAGLHGIALIQLAETEKEDIAPGSQYRVIVNSAYTRSNAGYPYIGVMIEQGKDGNGNTCNYLTPLSDKLKEFLLE